MVVEIVFVFEPLLVGYVQLHDEGLVGIQEVKCFKNFIEYIFVMIFYSINSEFWLIF